VGQCEVAVPHALTVVAVGRAYVAFVLLKAEPQAAS
jgi:hypothetical protein